MRDYPVQVDVTSPARFDRIQLAIRLALGLRAGSSRTTPRSSTSARRSRAAT